MISSNWYKLDIGTFTKSVTSTNPISQNIYIKKIKIIEIPPPPTFTLSSSSTTVDCNSTTPITFTVTNVYNSHGNLSFNWEVGNGWLYNGNTVSNFATTTNSIQLTPTQYPPSNVNVTPVLGGVSYSQLTSIVTLSNISTSGSIVGTSTLCSDSSFNFNNLQSGQTIVWSLSDPSVATISNSNSNPVLLNVTGNGSTTLTATISNSCGQSFQKTKDLFVGVPPSFNISIGSQEEEICDIKYHYIPYYVSHRNSLLHYQVQITYPHSASYSNGSNDSFVFKVPKNYNGGLVFSITASNSCGSASDFRDDIVFACNGSTAAQTSELNAYKIAPNPVGISQNIYFVTPSTDNKVSKTAKTISNVKIYDTMGNLVFSKVFKPSDLIILNPNLKKRNYIVNISDANGKTVRQLLIVE